MCDGQARERATSVAIRDARDEEAAAVRALTLRAYAELAAAMAPSAWAVLDGAVRAALVASSGDFDCIVAAEGDALLGAVRLYRPTAAAYGGLTGAAPWPEVRLLAVAPEARGRGLGLALMDECARRARAMEARELGLHTSDSLRAAVRLYERMGFRPAPAWDFQPEGAERVRAYTLALWGMTGAGIEPAT